MRYGIRNAIIFFLLRIGMLSLLFFLLFNYADSSSGALLNASALPDVPRSYAAENEENGEIAFSIATLQRVLEAFQLPAEERPFYDREKTGTTLLPTILASTTCLDCSINVADTSQVPDPNALAARCGLCIIQYGLTACTNACSAARWNEVVVESQAAGLNPTLVATIGVEETYFGAANPTYPFGCINPGMTGFSDNLDCAIQTLNNCRGECATCAQCSELMGMLACYASSSSTCSFVSNPNFNDNVTQIFDELGGTLVGSCADTGAAPNTCSAPGVVPPVEIGEECGGGTETVEGEGAVFENIPSCAACQEEANKCSSRIGVSGIAYLWDSITKTCGIGGCEKEDTCLGVDAARLNEIKADALDAVEDAKSFFPSSFGPADLLLALTWVESEWNQLFGTSSHPAAFTTCPAEQTAFEGFCSSQGPGFDGANPKPCLEMPISDDPDGAAGPICGGGIGISQLRPSIFNDPFLQPVLFQITNGTNPWGQREGLGATEAILSLRRSDFDMDACCLGKTPDACLAICGAEQDQRGLIDYHFGAGSSATIEPEEQAFVDQVLKFRPVMKSLLDTGACPKEPGVCLIPGGDGGGFDLERLQEILPHELAVVTAANSIVSPATPLRAAFTLAHLKSESGWRELIGDYPANTLSSCGGPSPSWGQCADEAAYFGPQICGNPSVALETFTKHGTACTNMTVTFDGGMGMASFQPATWAGQVAGTLHILQQVEPARAFVDPFREEDAMAANAYKNAWGLQNCGDERGAFFQYVSGNCAGLDKFGNPITWLHDKWDQVVEPDMNALQTIIDEGCTVGEIPGCPVNPPVTLNGDYCPIDPSACDCYKAGRIHRGVDLAADLGDPLFAVENNSVVEQIANDEDGWGIYVVLRGPSFHYRYAHMQDVAVSVGDTVNAGDLIGLADDTGDSDGDHLHLEMGLFNLGVLVDPRNYIACIPQNCHETFNP